MQPLKIAITSRALFDLAESHAIFATTGVAAYAAHQLAHESVPLKPGLAFNLVQKLLSLTHPKTGAALVEVLLISRNSGDTGLRIFNSITHYALPITRAVFTNGENPYPYLGAFGADLFLSAHADDVKAALKAGYAAATILPNQIKSNPALPVRIAFDGDAVLFAPTAQQHYVTNGLAAFNSQEAASCHAPLDPGAFKGLLQALHAIQTLYKTDCPIRTALITARAAPAHERVIRTLRHWQIRLDEVCFLGGLPKGKFLHAFGADFFFDDEPTNCFDSSQYVCTAHVPMIE